MGGRGGVLKMILHHQKSIINEIQAWGVWNSVRNNTAEHFGGNSAFRVRGLGSGFPGATSMTRMDPTAPHH